MIEQKSIEEVFETARIEDVVQDFVTLKRRGSNLIGLCPFHSEKTPSFSVSPSKNIFKCFGCGEGGGPVQFIMQHEHLSFPDAIRYLARKYHIELEETAQSEEFQEAQHKLESLYLVNQFALEYFQHELFETNKGKSIGLAYFKKRGFSEETIRKFGLGYAPPDPDKLTQAALQKGYSKELLQELGITTKFDRDFFRDRVMFTIRNLSGKVIAFAGRIMQKDAKLPKYINSPESEVYFKSKVLYGAYFAKTPIRKQDECILVEGYTDVISLHQAGIENVVASSGTSLTPDQVRLVKRYSPNIKILYDGDPAGIKAALRGLDIVLAEDMNVKVVVLPEGEDPDSYLQAVGPTVFREYIDQHAEDFIVFKAKLLMKDTEHDPIKKSEAVKDIVSSIAIVPDPLKRSFFIKECCNLTELPEKVLVDEVNKQLAQAFRKQQRAGSAARESLPDETPAPQPADTGPAPPQGDEFQERDIVRVLVAYGHHPYQGTVSIGKFILDNIADVLDYFDHHGYLEFVRLYQSELTAGRQPQERDFINHQQEKVRKLAVDMIAFPHTYSENWENRHGIFLNQKHPEENYIRDADSAVGRLKYRKFGKAIKKFQDQLKTEKDIEQQLLLMRAISKLQEHRNQLAAKFGIVVN